MIEVKSKELSGRKRERKIIFRDFANEYLSFSKSNKAEKSYIRDVTSLNVLNEYFGEEYLSEITPKGVETYKNQRIDRVKPGTINRELACLRHMLNKAVQWRYLRTNPMRNVKLLKTPPGRVRYLEFDEIQRLLDNVPPHLKPIIVCAVNTGLRRSEIFNLRWRDVNLESRVIFVEKTKNNELRAIPINGILYEELKNIHRYGEYVFSKPDGTPYKDTKKSFNNAVKKAGIRDFRFHDLRHTFASRLVMSGAGIQTVKELLGHKDIKMTMRYSHLSMTYKQEAVNELGARMKSCRRNKRDTIWSH